MGNRRRLSWKERRGGDGRVWATRRSGRDGAWVAGVGTGQEEKRSRLKLLHGGSIETEAHFVH